MTQHIVVIDHGDSHYDYRGPFNSAATAQQFADWATREIDPARIANLGDPLRDMLHADTYTETRPGECGAVTRDHPDRTCQRVAGHPGPHISPPGTTDHSIEWFSPCGHSYGRARCTRPPNHYGPHQVDNVEDSPVLCGAEHLYWSDDDQRNVTAECGLEAGHDGEHLDPGHRHAWPAPGKTCGCIHSDTSLMFRTCIRPAGHLPDHRSESGFLWVNDEWNANSKDPS